MRYTPRRVRRSSLLPAVALLLAVFPRVASAQAQDPPRLEFGGYVQIQYENKTEDGVKEVDEVVKIYKDAVGK